MRISDWSSDVCSSDLAAIAQVDARSWDQADAGRLLPRESAHHARDAAAIAKAKRAVPKQCGSGEQLLGRRRAAQKGEMRSEERREGKECVSTCRSRLSPIP